MLVCLLAAGSALADDKPLALCQGFHEIGGPKQAVNAVRAPIEQAITALDDAEIEAPSPVLATGKMSYLGVSVALPEDLNKVHVIGYFHLRGRHDCVIPLLVSHIDAVKPEAQQSMPTRTRIYFRVPDIDRITGPLEMYHSMSLRIAAIGAEEEGAGGKIYFGRKIELVVSSKYLSIAAALLFALAFYLAGAAAVAAIVRREASAECPALGRFERLLPWNIVCDNGQAALSQLQMLMFTLIVATLMFYQWLRTGLLQELSTDLLYLIGISTLGAAGGQLGASFKKGLEEKTYQYVQQLGWFTAPFARLQRRGDPTSLVMTNKRFDTNKFQMLVFTFVIAAYVIESGASELDNLHISSTLLTLMGISQGAYVGGAAVSDSMATLQHQLKGMQRLQESYRTSADLQVKEELRRRFALAAARAGAMFNSIYGREVPDYMLEMPIDADSTVMEMEEAQPAQA
jgi:hypothetical protein